MQKEMPLEIPTSVDLKSKQPANFHADINALDDTIGLSPVDEVRTGGPQIRYSLPGANQRATAVVNNQLPKAENCNYANYRDSLSDEHKALFDNFLTIEDKLPAGFTAKDLLEAKIMYKDIYLLELASGLYIYRALSAAEDLKIKNIKGMQQSTYMNHVVANCVIAPKMHIMEVDKSKLAGTKNTLYEQILAYSDFATDQTVSIKL